MNRHQFQYTARQFRAGKISLAEFTDQVLGAPGSQAETRPADGDHPPLPALPVRDAESHKGDFGRIVIIAGSRGMAGAAALAGMAALRSGAGMVTVATARACQDVVAGFHPALMTIGLPDDSAGRIAISAWAELEPLIPEFDCLATGPGMGTSPQLQSLLRDVFSSAPQTTVIDADGLNNLGQDFEWPTPPADRILTPHPGELRRLVEPSGNDRQTLEIAAQRLAERFAGAVVLKGHHSLITDGLRSIHNQSGNPGMATAGAGDVLTGIIAALVGQGLDAWDAAVLGCHVHGTAGDQIATERGQRSLVATDLIDGIRV